MTEKRKRGRKREGRVGWWVRENVRRRRERKSVCVCVCVCVCERERGWGGGREGRAEIETA